MVFLSQSLTILASYITTAAVVCYVAMFDACNEVCSCDGTFKETCMCLLRVVWTVDNIWITELINKLKILFRILLILYLVLFV